MKQKKVVSLCAASVLLISLSFTSLHSDSSEQKESRQLLVPLSIGELLDKITILEVKSEKIKNPDKLTHVLSEKKALMEIAEQYIHHTPRLAQLTEELFITNKKMWDIEDAIREKEAKKEFDDEFIQIARSVYFTNDHRGKLKHTINLMTQSRFVEEKQYTEYQ